MKGDKEFRQLVDAGICPICRKKLHHMEGCLECPACGWSLCKEA